MNIEHLDEFAFLADTLSFKQTADHFFVSRSVVSRHLAALEEQVGVRLVDRDSHPIALTEAGKVFHREAKVVLRDWDAALERVRSVGDGTTTLVRVGYLRNAARPVLVRFARRMAESHPEVRLSLSCMEYADLRRALGEHAVDVALAMNVNPAISRNYRSTRVYEDDFFAVCAPDHPLAARRRAVSAEDLRDCKVLLPDSFRDVGLSDLVDSLRGGGQPVEHAFYHDIDMLSFKVLAEGYVAFTSGLNETRFGGDVAMLPVSGVNTSFAVSAFYHDDFTGDAYAACCEAFEWCRDALS